MIRIIIAGLVIGCGFLYPLRSFADQRSVREIYYGEKITEIAFHPKGKQIVVAAGGRTIRVMDLATEKVEVMMDHLLGRYVAYSPDGKLVASVGWDMKAKLWDAGTGRHLRTLTGHMHAILCVAFSPDSKTVATGSYDGTLRLWDTETGKLKRTIKRNIRAVSSIAWSPDSNRIAAKDAAKSVNLWDVDSGEGV